MSPTTANSSRMVLLIAGFCDAAIAGPNSRIVRLLCQGIYAAPDRRGKGRNRATSGADTARWRRLLFQRAPRVNVEHAQVPHGDRPETLGAPLLPVLID